MSLQPDELLPLHRWVQMISATDPKCEEMLQLQCKLCACTYDAPRKKKMHLCHVNASTKAQFDGDLILV